MSKTMYIASDKDAQAKINALQKQLNRRTKEKKEQKKHFVEHIKHLELTEKEQDIIIKAYKGVTGISVADILKYV